MRARTARALALSAAASLALGCEGAHTTRYEFVFAEDALAAEARHIQYRIVADHCYGTDVVEMGEAEPDTPRDLPAATTRGTFGILALATDASCRFVARGCADVEVPSERDEVIRVVLRRTAEPTLACPPDECVDGVCTGGPCLPVPEVCNGVDDDCNGVADDGFDVERDPENCGYCGRVCAVPVCIAGHCGEEIEIVSAGSGHTCAKRYGGRVACWGGASDGQLGDGTILDRPIPTEVRECGEDGVCVDADSDGAIDPPAVVSDAVDLALGRDHSCMVRASGAVSCWGDGQCGRLGSGRGGNTSLPLRTQGVSGALRVGAGDWTSCAVLDGGSVACWGIREDQNPADGCGAPRLTAEPVAGLSGVDEVDTGYRYGCARAGGEVFCWGLGQTGQLGDGTTTTRLAPGAAVTGLDDAIAISTGSGHACAVRAGGTVVCWGSDSAGQLGDGMMHADCGGTECSNVPVAVAGLADALLVSAGSGFTCALLRDGTARCWGQNDLGQLGNGGLTAAPTPTPVMNVADARHLSAGAQHACAVLATGGVSCWGNNRGARLGRGGAIPTADEPTPTAAPVLLLP